MAAMRSTPVAGRLLSPRPSQTRAPGRAIRAARAARAAFVAIAAVTAVAALSGCVSGPDYVRPALSTPGAFGQEAPAGWKAAQASDHLPKGRWWTVFNDPTLDALVDKAMAANNTVRASEAAVRQSRAQLQQTAATRYPTITGGFNASATRGSASGASSSASSAGGLAGTDGLSSLGGVGGSGTVSSQSYRTGLDASWEVDLWGRVRRSVEAGEAQLQAAGADLENARLSVAAELARNYFDLRILDAQRQVLTDTVAAYQRSLQLTRNRYESGVVPRVDVVQAEVQWKSTQAQLVDTGILRSSIESAIALLAGQMPSTFRIEPIAGTAIPPVPVVPTGLPSELLERRPDVAAAERAVAASSAQIGAAQAAYYPSLSLSASVGLRASSFSQLVQSPAWFWSPALSALQVLFDAGQRKAITAQARAAHEGQVATYRQTVLQGFKEVEDNLATLRILEEEIALQAETLTAARLALQLVTNQYQAGVVNFLSVLTAQTSALNSERSLLDLRGRRLTASVALVKAVGGGWQGLDVGSVGGAYSAPLVVPAAGSS
jgi:NodT family efflux transporter outer membrane factor (OMF) lipoprotein